MCLPQDLCTGWNALSDIHTAPSLKSFRSFTQMLHDLPLGTSLTILSNNLTTPQTCLSSLPPPRQHVPHWTIYSGYLCTVCLPCKNAVP